MPATINMTETQRVEIKVIPPCTACNMWYCRSRTRCAVETCNNCSCGPNGYCYSHRSKNCGKKHLHRDTCVSCIATCAFPRCTNVYTKFAAMGRFDFYLCNLHFAKCMCCDIENPTLTDVVAIGNSLHRINSLLGCKLGEQHVYDAVQSVECPRSLRICASPVCSSVTDAALFCDECNGTYTFCFPCNKVFARTSRQGYDPFCTPCAVRVKGHVGTLISLWAKSRALLSLFRRLARGDEKMVEFAANIPVLSHACIMDISSGRQPLDYYSKAPVCEATPYFLLMMCTTLPRDVLNVIFHLL